MKLATDKLDSIVKRCQQGDEAAFRDLFRVLGPDIRRILTSLLGPDRELEDLIQIAALELFRSIKHFRGDSKFTTWFYRLVVNVALQHLRQRRNTPSIVELSEMAENLVLYGDSPEEIAEKRQQILEVREILAEISPKKRIVFLLHEVEGYSPEEIAEMVGSSRFTVKSRLFYAKKEFTRKLRLKASLKAIFGDQSAAKDRQ